MNADDPSVSGKGDGAVAVSGRTLWQLTLFKHLGQMPDFGTVHQIVVDPVQLSERCEYGGGMFFAILCHRIPLDRLISYFSIGCVGK